MATCSELRDQHLGLILAYDQDRTGVIETDDVTDATGDNGDGLLSDQKTQRLVDAWEQACQFDPNQCQPVINTYLDTLQQFDADGDGQISSQEVDEANTAYSNGNLSGDRFRAVVHAHDVGCTFSSGDGTTTTTDTTQGFSIGITKTDVPDAVCKRDDFTATYEVTNNGDETAQEITLELSKGNEVVATSESQMAPGDTQTVSATMTQEAGVSDFTRVNFRAIDTIEGVTVNKTTDDVDSLGVHATNKSLEGPDSACPGSTVEVTHRMTNDTECDSGIRYEINGREIDRQFNAGDEQSLSQEFEMPDGSLTIDVSVIAKTGGHQIDFRSITIQEDSFSLGSTTLTARNTACPGQDFFVTYDLQAEGSCSETLEVSIGQRPFETIELQGGGTARHREQFTMGSSDMEIGAEARLASTDEVLDRSSTTVSSPSAGVSTSLDVPSDVCTGRTFTATYNVENTSQCEYDYDLTLAGESRTVTLDSGGSTTIEEEFTMGTSDITITGEVVTTSTGDVADQTTKRVSVKEIDVNGSLDVPDDACPGDQITATYNLQNPSDCDARLEVVLADQGRMVNVSAGQSNTVEEQLEMGTSNLTVNAEASLESAGATLDSRSSTVKVGIVDTNIARTSHPDLTQIGEPVDPLTIVLSGNSDCTAPGTAQLVDRDTGNVLQSQGVQLGGRDDTRLDFSTNMPTKIFRGMFKVLNDDGQVELSSAFEVRPMNSVIIRTNESIDFWGGESSSINYKGHTRGSGLEPSNTEEQDTYRALTSGSIFDYNAESGGRDSILATKVDRLAIRSDTSVKFAVDGIIEGEGTEYTLSTGIVGTMGVLKPVIKKSIVDPSDREVVDLI